MISSESEVLELAWVLLVSQPQFDDFEWNVDLPLKLQVQTDQHPRTTELEENQINFKNIKANIIIIKNTEFVYMNPVGYHNIKRK